MSTIDVRAVDPGNAADAVAVAEILQRSWGSTIVISRGVAHDAARLPGFIAERDGAPAGLVTYHPAGPAWEIVTSMRCSGGAGSAPHCFRG